MDRPRHPQVIRTWKIEGIRRRKANPKAVARTRKWNPRRGN